MLGEYLRHGSSWWLVLLVVLALCFSPPLAFFMSVSGLILMSTNIIRNFDVLLPFLVIASCLSMAVAAASHPLFLYEEQDFTTYYNNYFWFVEHGFGADGFKFGRGFEVGLPGLHYLLSMLITAPLPGLLKLVHALFQIVLLVIICRKICVYHKINMLEGCLLIASMFVFFKFSETLNHLRQGYSSLFICLGLFAGRFRYLYFFIAVVFHLSALLIAPLTMFLLSQGSVRKLTLFSFLCAGSSILIFLFLKVISGFVTGSESAALGKLVWAFGQALSNKSMVQSIIKSLVASMYFIPLLSLSVLARLLYGMWPKITANLFAMYVFILAFSYLPAISSRVMAPFLTVLMGYLFFRLVCLDVRVIQARLIIWVFFVLFNFNWIFFEELYYYRYPLASSRPLYYLKGCFDVGLQVNRDRLPSKEDVVIQNMFH